MSDNEDILTIAPELIEEWATNEIEKKEYKERLNNSFKNLNELDQNINMMGALLIFKLGCKNYPEASATMPKMKRAITLINQVLDFYKKEITE